MILSDLTISQLPTTGTRFSPWQKPLLEPKPRLRSWTVMSKVEGSVLTH